MTRAACRSTSPPCAATPRWRSCSSLSSRPRSCHAGPAGAAPPCASTAGGAALTRPRRRGGAVCAGREASPGRHLRVVVAGERCRVDKPARGRGELRRLRLRGGHDVAQFEGGAEGAAGAAAAVEVGEVEAAREVRRRRRQRQAADGGEEAAGRGGLEAGVGGAGGRDGGYGAGVHGGGAGDEHVCRDVAAGPELAAGADGAADGDGVEEGGGDGEGVVWVLLWEVGQVARDGHPHRAAVGGGARRRGHQRHPASARGDEPGEGRGMVVIHVVVERATVAQDHVANAGGGERAEGELDGGAGRLSWRGVDPQDRKGYDARGAAGVGEIDVGSELEAP